MSEPAQKLRILMLITNLGHGGAERVFHDHTTAFAEHWAVEQVVFDGDYVDPYQTPLPLHRLKVSGMLAHCGPPGRLLGRAYALRQLVRRGRFDLVISHMDGANWVNILSGTDARKVLVVHGSVLHDKRQKGWRQWLRTRAIIPLLYRRAHAVVGVSKAIADELRGMGSHRATSLPNFFDIIAIQTAARQDLAPEHQKIFEGEVVVTSGRLSPQKNQKELLRLYASIASAHRRVRLVILGDGEWRNDLLSLAVELGLHVSHPWGAAVPDWTGDVCFLGYQSNPFRYLSRSTLFVFPSLWEGFPLALCEAMACGVPVVAADCATGPREILGKNIATEPLQANAQEEMGCGVLMPMLNDTHARQIWRATILELLKTPSQRKRLAAGALLRVQSFSKERVLGQWIQLIEQVAAE